MSIANVLRVLFLLAFVGQSAVAQQYEFFEIENETPTGSFGWDIFSGFYSQPHMTTIGDVNGVLTVTPSGGVVSSTMNLYSAGTTPRYEFAISNLDDTEIFTSVALQVAITGNSDGSPLLSSDFFIELDGMEIMPDDFEELGVRAQLAGAFDIYYYWVEWNGLMASADLTMVLQGVSNNLSFTAANISYFNSAEPMDITFGDPGVLLGDVNCDGSVNLLDVAPFVDLIANGEFSEKADMNQDGSVDLLDVGPFIAVLSG